MINRSPIKGCSHPDTSKIQCTDCVYRDKTVFEKDDGTIWACGAAKDTCLMYDPINKYGNGITNVNRKPLGILFANEPCEYYMQDTE